MNDGHEHAPREAPGSGAPASASAGTVAGHWRWRPDWVPGRRCLWWYLTLGDHRPLHEVARKVTSALTVPTLDIIPPRWLHLTLREVGYLDQTPAELAEDVIDRARRSLAVRPAFDLHIGPVDLLPGALVLRATPTGRLQELRRQLPGTSTSLDSPAGIPAPDQVPPHVSLAYLRSDTEASTLVMSPRHLTPLTVPVDHVTLAEVTRHQWHYQWNVRAHVPLLGGQRP